MWAALIPPSLVYSGALALRERWWRTRASAAGVATISVGNLTVGGNGKTPFTLFLASRLQQRGVAVAIISRGWGGTTTDAALVSDGKTILLSPQEAGDEPVMMAKVFAGPIAIARRRIDAARLLSTRGHFEAFILDDGFQHLRVRRDLNLLLINSARGFGNGWVIPAGPLREPRDGVARADAVVLINPCGIDATGLTGGATASSIAAGNRISADLRLPEHIPIVRASLRPRALVHADAAGWHESPLALEGARVVAVSGLADPAGFHAMLSELGATLVATLAFPDHHDYTPRDLENIRLAARDADHIVTTEKDLVKLERFPLAGISLYALRLEISMAAGDEARLFDLVAARILSADKTRTPGNFDPPRVTGHRLN